MVFPLMAVLLVAACGKKEPKPLDRRQDPKAAADADAMPSTTEELGEIIGSICEPGKPTVYGTKELVVPATAYWVSTGLYLKAGQTADIEATGLWTNWKGVTAPFGPDGHSGLTEYEGCEKGALVARVGLAYEGGRHCVGSSSTLEAGKDGIVYLAMNDGSSPLYHGGEVSVTVTSSALPAPTVAAEDVKSRDFCEGGAQWTELEGRHVLLTVPTALVKDQKEHAPKALELFDKAYEAMRELAGGETPYGGAPIRYYPDFEIRELGWILAGNPVRYDPKNLNGVYPAESSILRSADPAVSSFEMIRSLGVGFSRIRGRDYQTGTDAAQGFAGLFTLYALEELGREDDLPRTICYEEESHLESGSLAGFDQDPWLQMCLYVTLKDAYGWEMFTRFFQSLPQGEGWASVLPSGSTREDIWRFVAVKLAEAAQDPTALSLLDSFKLPPP